MGTSINTGSDKQTYYKLGMYGAEPDSPVLMARDLFAGGAVHGDLALVEAAVSQQAFAHLAALGVPFPHDEFGQHIGYKTDHDPKRRATSCGPYTSRDMCLRLIDAVKSRGIPVLEDRVVFSLLTAPDGDAKRCVGAALVNRRATKKSSMSEFIRAHIPDKILSPEQISLEPAILGLCDEPRGLVLVTGPTGSGKTTTLATMLDQINRKRRDHILTIEDPIEFVHPEYSCVVTQRELHAHTHSFANALRSALREDPDVILVGEMRDLETISLALTAAETGHLVFATLHTTDAAQTVDRVIDVFPPAQQEMVRTQLGAVLRAVVCQTLFHRASGKGRVAAREIMLSNPAISTLIRENQTQKLYATMAMGIKDGQCPLEYSMAAKIKEGLLRYEDARIKANRPDSLDGYLKGMGVDLADLVAAAGAPPSASAPSSPPPPPAGSAAPAPRKSLFD